MGHRINMEEKKFVQYKKDELGVTEFVKNALGKGRISSVKLEYTPVGEKIIVTTSKPGFVIGRRGEKLNELSVVLKKKFNLENPHIDIQEVKKPEFDAQTVADDIALSLERLGSIKFKVIAYKTIERIMRAGALGVEIRLSGKLPSERAKSWRFALGYLKKTGDQAKVVHYAESVAKTRAGVIGVKVSILTPDAEILDRIIVDDELLAKIKSIEVTEEVVEEEEEIPQRKKKKSKIVKTAAQDTTAGGDADGSP